MEKYKHLSFPTEYEKIIERVNAIDPIKYAKTRNFINGQITYLSPYITRGVISTYFIYHLFGRNYPPSDIWR